MNAREESRRRHPSRRNQHHMASWPLRATVRQGMRRMERICTHGIGHPDPDWRAVSPGASTLHTCDGCCEQRKPSAPIGFTAG